MLPPSPTHYQQQRFTQAPPPAPSPSPAQHAERRNLPTQHRPGSSMSISSMLGSDSDKPTREPAQLHSQNGGPSYSHSNPSTSLIGVMSPPQHTPRPTGGEYSYKPRSQTPEQFSIPNLFATRPHRSSSGSMVQRPGPFGEAQRSTNNTFFSRFGDSAYPSSTNGLVSRPEEMSDSARRTSISELMQRPNSQPQSDNAFTMSRPAPFTTPSARPSWLDYSGSNNSRNANYGNSAEPVRRQSLGGESRPDINSAPRQSEAINSYDTRPPAFSNRSQQSPLSPQDRDRTSQPHTETTPLHPTSPDAHRQSDPSPSRVSGNFSNERSAVPNALRAAEPQLTSQPMAQQDSSQSQSERSNFGDRLERSRLRLFSPFASSVTS